MNLADKLKTCRSTTKLTQAEVAKTLHISRKTISGWENNHSYPDITSLVKLSDIYNVSLDNLLRDDKLLESYALQNKKVSLDLKIASYTYYFNIIFWLLSYIELFRPWGIYSHFIPLLLLINMLIFMSHFSDWIRFKKKIYLIIALSTFVFIFILHVCLNVLDFSFLNYFNYSNIHFLVGLIIGRILLVILISLSLEIILLFNPYTKKTKC